jgi:hypothetical protein
MRRSGRLGKKDKSVTLAGRALPPGKDRQALRDITICRVTKL